HTPNGSVASKGAPPSFDAHQSRDALLPRSLLPRVAPDDLLQCEQMMRSPGVPPPPRTAASVWSQSIRRASVMSPSHLCVHPLMPHGHHVFMAYGSSSLRLRCCALGSVRR